MMGGKGDLGVGVVKFYLGSVSYICTSAAY